MLETISGQLPNLSLSNNGQNSAIFVHEALFFACFFSFCSIDIKFLLSPKKLLNRSPGSTGPFGFLSKVETHKYNFNYELLVIIAK